MTLTMNHTFYAPRTDIAIGFQHPFMNQPATTTNFIYFKMMQTPSSSVVQQHSLTTTVVQQQEVSGESASSQIPSKTKGKEHSSSQSNQQDSMEDDNDDDWIDVDEDDNVVPSKPKSKHFYFRHSEDSDDESDEEDEEDEDEEMDEDDEFVDDTIEIPFWYGNEDSKHTEFVMKEYSSFLQLNKDRHPNSRLPIRFIGKIVREATEDTVISIRDEDEDSDDDDSLHMQRVLITSETIYIYQKSVQSPELCCKFDTSITVQTFYDYEEGVPISILIQPETEWDISSLDNVTLLECFPSFGLDPYAFEYGSHRVMDARQILPHTLETSLGNAGLFNQCLQNSAGCLAKLKPKQQNESPKAE